MTQIQTSPLAKPTWEIRKALRKLYDPMQTTRWMMLGHDCFDGLSVIDMVKAGRVDEVMRAIAALKNGGDH
jgi:hypothetical protein